MRKPFLLLALIISFLSFWGVGCWDIRDLSNRAFVTAIGLDVPEDSDKQYKVTFEFLDPFKLQDKKNKEGTIVETLEADSIGQAIEEMQARIANTITFSHLRLLLVGEELAKAKNFKDLSNFFEKFSEVALRLKMSFVQEGTAKDVLMSRTKFSDTVSDEYINMSQLEEDFSLQRTNTFYYFLGDLRGSQGVALGSRIVLSEGKYIIRHGATVFDQWQLQGFLSSEETRSANWLMGKGKTTVLGKTGEGIYSYRVDKRHLEIIPATANGQVSSFEIKLETDGMITEEYGKHLDLTIPENINELEALFSDVIAKEIQTALNKAQKNFKVDYLGLGKVLKNKEPKIYEGLDWHKVFPTLPVNVDVKAKINRFGLSK